MHTPIMDRHSPAKAVAKIPKFTFRKAETMHAQGGIKQEHSEACHTIGQSAQQEELHGTS
eukprot:CAMPEP_0206509390 /NCGR_PEP_ID=MMETSP0324_2-20121206/58898_1 /ASSEMBLY_ACC=CAM_ASM_000836 /TAXON_ID=2866 /ORGANISM="Crypthecodinium cohnii, Strain Seligo" /LENGTH=59 /DNA_ID=CAMNT_0054000433 /DNA_START=372 /DNA_END=548 /DNA_ORIENTATION=-